jgi:hypothetical protein
MQQELEREMLQIRNAALASGAIGGPKVYGNAIEKQFAKHLRTTGYNPQQRMSEMAMLAGSTGRIGKAKVDPNFFREKHIRENWGISLSDKQKMVDSQEGRCAICNSSDLVGRNCAIDHDHKTGKIRGILCQKCNQGLGLFLDNEEILQNAIIYLKKSRI